MKLWWGIVAAVVLTTLVVKIRPDLVSPALLRQLKYDGYLLSWLN